MDEPKNFWDIFKSRKFWVLALALVVATAAMATGKIDGWQYTQAVVIALAAYSTGVAIEDAGAKAGAGIAAGRSQASLPGPPSPLPAGEETSSRIVGPPAEDIYKINRRE